MRRGLSLARTLWHISHDGLQQLPLSLVRLVRPGCHMDLVRRRWSLASLFSQRALLRPVPQLLAKEARLGFLLFFHAGASAITIGALLEGSTAASLQLSHSLAGRDLPGCPARIALAGALIYGGTVTSFRGVVATDSGILPCVLLDYEFLLVGEVGLTFANRSSRLALQLLRELQQSAHHRRFFVKTSRCRLHQCLVLLRELRRVQQVTKVELVLALVIFVAVNRGPIDETWTNLHSATVSSTCVASCPRPSPSPCG